jgi:hypothetical protein
MAGCGSVEHRSQIAARDIHGRSNLLGAQFQLICLYSFRLV